MDGVQRQRNVAYQYGYLRTNPYDNVVDSGGYVQILPVNPAYVDVPTYDPLVVFSPPRLGIGVRGAFAPWGWDDPTLTINHVRLLFSSASDFELLNCGGTSFPSV